MNYLALCAAPRFGVPITPNAAVSFGEFARHTRFRGDDTVPAFPVMAHL